MDISSERYFPVIDNPVLGPFEPFISYEHYHRYLYALPFVAGKKVLDIACGEGYGSALLAAHAASVVGVDIAADAVQHASQKYVLDNLRFLRASADFIPIPDHHSFDAVVSFETIEHLDAATQEEFALEVKRLLKPDGVLLMSTPNRATYTVTGAENPYHLREFTTEEYLQFLRRHFEHVRLLSQHVYPVSYLWNLDGPRGPLAEYQMALEKNVFRPLHEDGKAIGYLVAVCTDRENQAAAVDSLLVDLSEVAFRRTPHTNEVQMTSLYLDSGLGFRAEEVTREQVLYNPDFAVTFTLNPGTPIRGLRWDPVETRLCQINLKQVVWQEGTGAPQNLNLDQVSSNGKSRGVGNFRFETLDPMVFLPISGAVSRVTISGQCTVENEISSLIGLHHALQSRENLLAQQNEELQELREQLAASEDTANTVRRHMQALVRRGQGVGRPTWPWMRAG